MASSMTPEELEASGIWMEEDPPEPTEVERQRQVILAQQQELQGMREEMMTWRRQMQDVRRSMTEQGISFQVRRQVDEDLNLQVPRQVDESPLASPLASTINMER